MKDKIPYIVAILVVLMVTIYINSKNNDLKAQISHLNNTHNISMSKSINDAKKITTDSLINIFNELPPDTIIKTKIQYKYETIIDSIFVLPDSVKLRYITTELNRLYND